MARRSTKTYPLQGGLNLVDPQNLLPGGAVVSGRNMECLPGPGYERMLGYERYDGILYHSASNATYKRVAFVGVGPAALNPGDEIDNGGGIYNLVVATDMPEGWAGPGFLYLQTFQGGASPITLYLNTIERGYYIGGDASFSPTKGDPKYKEAMRWSRNHDRAFCGKPDGSGKILGVFTHNGVRYCFRNNVGGTAAAMFKSTTGGWAPIDLGSEISFTAGGGTFTEGNTLTQGAVTATVKRVVQTSGLLSGNTAAGRLIIGTVAGGSFGAGAATISGGGTLTLAGAKTTVTLAPYGIYEIIRFNFAGAGASFRFYGVDGENFGFEFDPTGDVYVQIKTGMPVDKPQHVTTHMSRLWYTFPGGSVQWSSVMTDVLYAQYVWNAITGAGELSIGDDCTGIKALKQDQLCVMGRNSAFVLYGTSFTTANFVRLQDNTGGVPRTLDEIAGQTIVADNIGVYFLEATQVFGDFKTNALSRTVQHIIDIGINNIRCALVTRAKSQYRLYFGDKTGLTATFHGGKLTGWFPFSLAHQINCVYPGEDASGNEDIVAGTDDGYVVLLETGPSHDGQKIESLTRLPFIDLGSPLYAKRFYTVRPTIYSPQPIDLQLYVEFDYGKGPNESTMAVGADATGALWGDGVWGNFYWGAQVVGTPVFDIVGIGNNISLTFRHHDDFDEPWTINSNLLDYEITKGPV